MLNYFCQNLFSNLHFIYFSGGVEDEGEENPNKKRKIVSRNQNFDPHQAKCVTSYSFKNIRRTIIFKYFVGII